MDILVYWIRKNCLDMCPGGSQTLEFLHARRAPYPLLSESPLNDTGEVNHPYKVPSPVINSDCIEHTLTICVQSVFIDAFNEQLYFLQEE